MNISARLEPPEMAHDDQFLEAYRDLPDKEMNCDNCVMLYCWEENASPYGSGEYWGKQECDCLMLESDEVVGDGLWEALESWNIDHGDLSPCPAFFPSAFYICLKCGEKAWWDGDYLLVYCPKCNPEDDPWKGYKEAMRED